MEEFADAFAYEVKQEIADRYFGFRSRIEAESSNYLTNLQVSSHAAETKISLNLRRMQILLRSPILFRDFLNLVVLPVESAQKLDTQYESLRIEELFEGFKIVGFTRWRRYLNLAGTIYCALAREIENSHKIFLELQEDHEDICAQITIFLRQNDICAILSFLRDLNPSVAEQRKFLHSDTPLHIGAGLESDLRIVPPPPAHSIFPLYRHIPPIKTITKQLDHILKESFNIVDRGFLKGLPF